MSNQSMTALDLRKLHTKRGGRGAPPTQVNYHQQPNRTGGGGPQQSRNPGYSTTPNSQTTYNSSSQPAYTTQTTFSTAPPPTTQTKPQPPAAAQPPLPAQTPATPQTPTTPQPQVKQEPPTPTDTPKTETSTTSTSENGDGPKPFWKKKPFVKVSNKVRKARQNAKLRRILNPKNALTFLNELRPGGVKFVIREEPGWGFVASVEMMSLGGIFSSQKACKIPGACSVLIEVAKEVFMTFTLLQGEGSAFCQTPTTCSSVLCL
ncbi:hypothetical protein J6590_080650 [Homalodisca vitripennis]|nr:hypothetical protein J6590_080650 [Homalodisca vitripennis]